MENTINIKNQKFEINGNAHLTSLYILEDGNGNLYSSQYRPTENYRYHKPSANDIGVNACGCYIVDNSHDLWLGDVVDCKIISMAHFGLVNNILKLKIVAKAKYVWDYSLPIGCRKVDNKETKDFKNYFNAYRNQSK